MNKDLEKAINRAIKAAKKRLETMFVFYEYGDGYQIGDDYDAVTYFGGLTPVCACTSAGEIESY